VAEELESEDSIVNRMRAGDPHALAELFDKHRPRLRRMVKLRMDRRLLGRLDPSDVLQEAFLDVFKRQSEYLDESRVSPFLWFRFLTGQRLLALHRMHLGTQMRDAVREVAIQRGAMPEADSISLANLLLGRLTTPAWPRSGPRCRSGCRTCSIPWIRLIEKSCCCATSRS
jgi:RNA polymerase sigma-70 factor (ECF subfamily)